MKTCFKCGETKELSEFYKHPEMADGHLGKCKQCTKKDVNQRYYSKIEQIKNYEHNRSRTKERRLKALEYQKTKRLRYPDKYYAHNAVSKAVSVGYIKKQPCEVCGSNEVQAHHEDYSKPLDVKWLCFKHHRKVHGQLTYED